MSVVIGFVLLAVLALILVGGVVAWLSTTEEEARQETEEMIDEEDINFYIDNVETDSSNNIQSITIVNNGRNSIPHEELSVIFEGNLEEVSRITGEDPIPTGGNATIHM
ncbi:MAG: hypothetical protein ACLFTQ_04050 [Candidatus Aenigmatarchaeota archaeon]